MKDTLKNGIKKSCLGFAWKAKAIKRRWELKALGKRMKEVEEGRILWKKKANERLVKLKEVEHQLKKVKKQYEELLKKK